MSDQNAPDESSQSFRYRRQFARQNRIERLFELFLWNSRFLVLLAVVFSLLSSFALFVRGSFEIGHALLGAIRTASGAAHETLVVRIIGGIDLYLIGVILLLVSFGLYELFISKIDVARAGNSSSILDIQSLDELKGRITKVIIMVLIVSFFQRALSMPLSSPVDMTLLAASILLICLGVYFLNRPIH